ncbi:hypothetical protein [Limnohabitans sp. 2KL-3]|uniref:hypothetical protein n=1 Tax=Limnohabitans sp. 2KL-3 TaxID=1100700 RepID=UPI000AD7326F|nr:hypothetical protein [Limnohabitans sp. 2KL-3]
MNHLTRFAVATVALYLAVTSTHAQHASYARVRLADGPVLEYPSHWKIADDATVQNRVHASQATAEAAGIDLNSFQKRNRIIIESQPSPSAAQIRASIITPQEYTQEDLRAATANDLRTLKTQFETMFRSMSASGTVKLHKMSEPRIEKVAGKFALVIPYTRYTEFDPVLWVVEQVKIPFEDKTLSISISYRTSDASAMKPILERIKRTLLF